MWRGNFLWEDVDKFVSFRSLMQNARGLPFGVPCQICWLVHVLRVSLQHCDEDLLHLIDCIHHLLDEIQETVLLRKYWDHARIKQAIKMTRYLITLSFYNLDLWQDRRWLPSSSCSPACCHCSHRNCQLGLDPLGIGMEFLLVARGPCLYPPNLDAQ